MGSAVLELMSSMFSIFLPLEPKQLSESADDNTKTSKTKQLLKSAYEKQSPESANEPETTAG